MKQPRSDIEGRILGALKRAPRSTRRLAEILDIPLSDVESGCMRLQKSGAVGAGLRDSEDRRIHKALVKNGGLSTTRLARELGIQPKRAYQRCRRLQDTVGLLRSHPELSPRRLYFFPVNGQVLTQASYPGIEEHLADLEKIGRGIAKQHGVTRPKQKLPKKAKERMRAAYLKKLDQLRKDATTPAEEYRIDAFESELMRVLKGTPLAEVLALMGLRRFVPKIRVWEELPGDPNVWYLKD